jgi:hypothetical protein
MRKLSFLALGFIAILSVVSCTKENFKEYVTPVGPEPHRFASSEWTMDGQLTWEDGPNSNKIASWNAEPLSQEVIDNGGLLVYGKSNFDGSVNLLPSSFFITLNPDEFDLYECFPTAGSISLFHTKSVNGVFETPGDVNQLSFKYIIIDGPIVPSNGRTPTNGTNAFTVDDLRTLSYDEVISILGLPY